MSKHNWNISDPEAVCPVWSPRSGATENESYDVENKVYVGINFVKDAVSISTAGAAAVFPFTAMLLTTVVEATTSTTSPLWHTTPISSPWMSRSLQRGDKIQLQFMQHIFVHICLKIKNKIRQFTHRAGPSTPLRPSGWEKHILTLTAWRWC